MNAVIYWKEYRQHRFLWLAMSIVAVLVIVSFVTLFGSGGDATRLQSILDAALPCLAVAYGAVVGALLMAGEAEDGTLPFLDSQIGRRTPIWNRKLLAGSVFTSAQCLVVIGLALALGSVSLEAVILTAILAFHALAWGMLAGAWRRTVLGAVLIGIGCMVVFWLLSLVLGGGGGSILFQTAAAVLAVYGSSKIFCRDDFSRQPVRAGRSGRSVRVFQSSSWRVLIGLAIRQGRWVVVGVIVGAVALGCAVNISPVVVWPIGTLLLGLTCGLAAFIPDQDGGKQFLAAQRIPLGRVWAVKTIGWATVLFVAAPRLVWYLATGLVWLLDGCIVHTVDGRRSGQLRDQARGIRLLDSEMAELARSQ